MRSRLLTGLIVVVVLAVGGVGVLYAAGNGPVDPPAPPGSTSSYTLAQVYDRLNTGAMDAPQSGFTEPASGPGTGTMHSLDAVMAQAPEADNTNGATAADVKGGKTFWGLRTDGTWGNKTGTLALRAAPPCFDNSKRYWDCGNGTVTDTVTGLIWLKNANCFELQNYAAANTAAAGLQTGACGLTDSSTPGDWRLPTREEFEAILLSSCPTVPRIAGNGSPVTGCYSANPWATGVQSDAYWTSTTYAGVSSDAWYVYLGGGHVYSGAKAFTFYVWPVRGGQ
jgi:hypothetical protein